VRDVIANGADVTFAPLLVTILAVTLMSPTEELNAVPVELAVTVAPVVDERWTLLAPVVTLQEVPAPPLEVNVIEVA
jgi:hypothetical protein